MSRVEGGKSTRGAALDAWKKSLEDGEQATPVDDPKELADPSQILQKQRVTDATGPDSSQVDQSTAPENKGTNAVQHQVSSAQKIDEMLDVAAADASATAQGRQTWSAKVESFELGETALAEQDSRNLLKNTQRQPKVPQQGIPDVVAAQEKQRLQTERKVTSKDQASQSGDDQMPHPGGFIEPSNRAKILGSKQKTPYRPSGDKPKTPQSVIVD